MCGIANRSGFTSARFSHSETGVCVRDGHPASRQSTDDQRASDAAGIGNALNQGSPAVPLSAGILMGPMTASQAGLSPSSPAGV
jgi:hypothetical protein